MNYRRLANVLALVVVIAAIAPFVVYTVPAVVGADHSFLVLSGSMEPELSPGDAILVEETDPQTIEEGDIVTYVRSEEETPVTHRVVAVQETDQGLAFETKGDANEQPDSSSVPAENVIGTHTLTIPYIGYVVQFANTPAGFALLVGGPIALLLGSEAWSVVRSGRVDDESDDKGVADGSAAGAGAADSASETAAQSVESNAVDATAEGEAATAEDEATTPEDEAANVTLDLTDLTLTLGLLAIVAPYAVYVALELQSTLTIMVAFATGFSVLLLGGLRLFLWATTETDGDAPDDAVADSTAESSPPDEEEPEGSGSHWPGAFETPPTDASTAAQRSPETDGGADPGHRDPTSSSLDTEPEHGVGEPDDPTETDSEVDR